MADRIIKDIRLYESNKQNIAGESIPSELGTILIPTSDTNYIAQRIARKLNELKCTYGEFDHVYINLTSLLKENEINVSSRNIDKRIKYIDFGINPEKVNLLSDNEKDNFTKVLIFKSLEKISNDLNLNLIKQTKKLITEFDTEIKIYFKEKETNSYKIDIHFQIKPKNSSSRAVVKYWDKKNNLKYQGFILLEFYDDIYTLIDSVIVKDNILIFNQKKSFIADLSNKRYNTPIQLKISELEKI